MLMPVTVAGYVPPSKDLDETIHREVILDDVLRLARKYNAFMYSDEQEKLPEDERQLLASHATWVRDNLGTSLKNFIMTQISQAAKVSGAANGQWPKTGKMGSDYTWREIASFASREGQPQNLVAPGVIVAPSLKNRRHVHPANPDTQRLPKLGTPTPVKILVPDFDHAAKYKGPGRQMSIMYNQTVDTPDSEDMVMRRVLDFSAHNNNTFPSLKRSAFTPRQKAFWGEQETWLLTHHNISLSNFIQRWTCEMAEKYRADHGGQQPNTSSGEIKGFEPHTWKNLIEAFAKDSYKTPFVQVISRDTHGNPVGSPQPEGMAADIK